MCTKFVGSINSHPSYVEKRRSTDIPFGRKLRALSNGISDLDVFRHNSGGRLSKTD